MDLNEAIETLISYSEAFANNVLSGRDANNALAHIADAAEILRTALVKEQAVTVGNYEI